jgi:hypothetical protein
MPLFFIESEVKELIEKTKRLETIAAFLLEHAGLNDPTIPAPVPVIVEEPLPEIEIDQELVQFNDLGFAVKIMFPYFCPECSNQGWAEFMVKRGVADGRFYDLEHACGKKCRAQVWQDRVLGKARKIAAETGESEQLILTRLRADETLKR